MALADILQKIQKETEEKLKKLEEGHKAKLKKLEDEYEKKKKVAAEDMEKKVAANVEKIHNKAKILAKMEAKNKLLKEKRELIDKLFDEALEKLSKSSEYEKFITSLMSRSSLEGDVYVVPAKGKEDETKKAIKESKKDYKLVDKPAPIKGGFILKTDKIEVDNSFESILKKELKYELELEIAKILF